jgi:hypothetical protein
MKLNFSELGCRPPVDSIAVTGRIDVQEQVFQKVDVLDDLQNPWITRLDGSKYSTPKELLKLKVLNIGTKLSLLISHPDSSIEERFFIDTGATNQCLEEAILGFAGHQIRLF